MVTFVGDDGKHSSCSQLSVAQGDSYERILVGSEFCVFDVNCLQSIDMRVEYADVGQCLSIYAVVQGRINRDASETYA